MVIKKIIKAAAKKGLKSKSKARKVRSHKSGQNLKGHQAILRKAKDSGIKLNKSEKRILKLKKSKATIERDRNQKKFVAMHKKVQAKRKPRFNPMAKKNQPTGSVTRNMSVGGTPIYERYEPTGLGSFQAVMGGRYKSGKKFGKIKPKSSMTKKYFPFSQTGKPTRVGGMTQSELDRVYPNSRWATKRGLHERVGSNILNFFADTTKTRTDKALWGTVGGGTAALPAALGIDSDARNKKEAKRISDLKKGQRDLKAEQKAYEDEVRGEPGPYSAYPSP